MAARSEAEAIHGFLPEAPALGWGVVHLKCSEKCKNKNAKLQIKDKRCFRFEF